MVLVAAAALLVVEIGATDRVLVTVATTLGELLEVALAGAVIVELSMALDVEVDEIVLRLTLDELADVAGGGSVLVTTVVTGGWEKVVVNVVRDGLVLTEIGPGGRVSELWPIVSVGPLDKEEDVSEGSGELELVIGTLTVTVTVVVSSEETDSAATFKIEPKHMGAIFFVELTCCVCLPCEQALPDIKSTINTPQGCSSPDQQKRRVASHSRKLELNRVCSR